MKLNFDDLTVNLYEVLSIKSDASLLDIKNSYKKLVIKYHPDKNPHIDPDLFSLISIAYKVLKKQETRNKYDNYLNSKEVIIEDHHTIKNNFNNFMNTDKKNNKEFDNKNFFSKMQELNNKHNYHENNEVLDNNSLTNKVSNLEKTRNNLSIKYGKTFNKYNKGNFNETFDKFKNGDKKLNIHNQTIIKADKNIIPSAFNDINNTSSNYSSIENINDLYCESGNFYSNKYTSLESAFSVKKLDSYNDIRTIEQKIRDRELETHTIEKNN